MDSLITRAKLLAPLSNNKKYLKLKKRVICQMNGFSGDAIHLNHRYMSHIGTPKLVMKPQTFHSAVAMFILLKYPHLRKPNSFIDKIIAAEGAEAACMKLSQDILKGDEDGRDLIQNGDTYFGPNESYILVDDANQKIDKFNCD